MLRTSARDFPFWLAELADKCMLGRLQQPEGRGEVQRRVEGRGELKELRVMKGRGFLTGHDEAVARFMTPWLAPERVCERQLWRRSARAVRDGAWPSFLCWWLPPMQAHVFPPNELINNNHTQAVIACGA